ncbi:toll/interleukin-1 receptor domain-containing protein [Pontibacillus sp. ALD_SL1]|uniref:toll/interleukin-1 receptor domain-containing protein n=1 Tax=Pontibacillus sp. ALD_SL1 TaxID=2777185 RepID=UPI001A976E8B|nr:toll/interleukin-1 receptor domain-containing protein [Pontibacillus sp. ALD_SL1]
MDTLKSLKFDAQTYKKLVKDYIDDPYINKTFDNLITCLESKDYEGTMFFLEKILNWYTSNLQKIENNEFVNNYDSHFEAAVQITNYFHTLKELSNRNELGIENFDVNNTTHPKETILGNRIFISHSSKDERICTAFVNLLEVLGVPEENILYSSSERFGIPAGKDIFEYLKDSIVENFNVFYMLSDNYYNSVYCLNEMGAAWINQNDFSIYLLPNFHQGIEGVIDKNVKGSNLTSKVMLNQLRDKITHDFNTSISENRWEEEKDKFLEVVNSFEV